MIAAVTQRPILGKNRKHLHYMNASTLPHISDSHQLSHASAKLKNTITKSMFVSFFEVMTAKS